jgi:hypothetical protein
MGQVCAAGSRIFVQEGVYDQFLEHFTAAAKALGDSAGDPFAPSTLHGPQISLTQFDVCYHLSVPVNLISTLAYSSALWPILTLESKKVLTSKSAE